MLVRFIPGNVVELMVAEMGGSGSAASGITAEEMAEVIRHQLGLDVPLARQYLIWLGKIVHGDLGTSLWTNHKISSEILAMIPVTLELGGFAVALALILGVPFGVISAVYQDSLPDYLCRLTSIINVSIPRLWLGTMLLVYPSIWWNWMPPMTYSTFSQDPKANLAKVFPAAVILSLGMMGSIAKLVRSTMLDVLRQDYIRTAWAKGLSGKTVVLEHAFRNACLPVLTMIGNQFPVIVGGSALLEQVFTLPGMGRYLINALYQRDYPVITAVTLLMAAVILIVNLLVDILYFWLDPRIESRWS